MVSWSRARLVECRPFSGGTSLTQANDGDLSSRSHVTLTEELMSQDRRAIRADSGVPAGPMGDVLGCGLHLSDP